MGGVQSSTKCTQPLNPDLLSVITLSDSAVQRLPLESDDSPLDKELRNQNIDDYWRDRLECMDEAYSEAKRLTEKEFARLEFAIKKMAPGAGKLVCPRMIEDTLTCYLTYPEEPLTCTNTIQNLQLCLDTVMQESSKKKYEDFLREEKKKKRC